MKKLSYLLTAVLVAGIRLSALTEKDLPNSASIITILDRSVSWSAFVGTGMVYVYSVPNVNNGVCLFIKNNNPTNIRNFTIAAWQTSDPTITKYNTGSFWDKVVTEQLAVPFIVPQLNSFQFYLPLNGAVRAAIFINNETGVAGGVPDTADVVAIAASSCSSATTGGNFTTSSGIGFPSGGTGVTQPNQWSISAAPAAGAVASVSRPANAQFRHTIQAISVTSANTGAAATQLDVAVRDGACGAGTIIWEFSMDVTAVAGTNNVYNISGLSIPGTVGNAMCIEFLGIIANIRQRVQLVGIDQ